MAAGLLPAACITGERPSFEDSPTVVGTMTGDEVIDAVLTSLDAVDGAVFTGDYTATLAFGGTASTMRVTQSAPGRTSVTIGDIRYLVDGSTSQTCRLSTGVCEAGIAAAAVSDTGLTPEFVFGDLAKRLRRDSAARIGPPIASTTQIAGQPANCVDVPVDGGTKSYCALSNGVVARFIGGDVALDLIGYTPAATDLLFTPTGA